MISGSTLILDGNRWLLDTDPNNIGKDLRWYNAATDDAKSARVLGIIQEIFPTYHGVVWYWHEFSSPENPHAEGQYLLKFWQVDYLADVWLNGIHVGQHEGTGDPFVLDITEAIKLQATNKIAVRALNPKNEH